MNKMNLFFLILFFLLLVPSNQLWAHPGRTAGDGCHYCRTNCASWGVTSGARHCHNAKSISQPPVPIKTYDPPSLDISPQEIFTDKVEEKFEVNDPSINQDNYPKEEKDFNWFIGIGGIAALAYLINKIRK